jgi:hypothetical protein
MSVRYCGRDFSEKELTQIRQLIADHPACSRAQLSRMTCQALQWFKADGGLKEMSARVAMLRMQDDGLITLPPPLCARPDPTVHLTDCTAPGALIEQPAGALRPLTLQRVQCKADSRLWNEYIERYHYLGHKPLPGAQLRHFIHADKKPIAHCSATAPPPGRPRPVIAISAGAMSCARKTFTSLSTTPVS